ncbi:c-type cytochrome [Bordetella genomosp. 13]|uniref:c-type cytochrome n=1 Tax=Bordetella genomosp. 13 TaxID=463040 RepID=UPI0011A7221A|nr:cytochrome c [Bordetella genomosp. 13]
MRLIARILLALLLLIAAAAGATYWLGTREDAGPPSVPATDPAAQLERGRYLALVGNCMTCHTARGGKAYAGGTPVPTPFGTLYGPNITPDAQTGIGAWTADEFWNALHNGKSRDGTLLYPAFPYTEYTRVSRADSDALYAYLRTIPAVSQASRAPELRFPYDQRPLLAAWRVLYFTPGVLEDDADRPAQWNRGRYLTQGMGHCAACHAPRNGMGATVDGAALGGGLIPMLDWYAPALSGSPATGLGNWSAEDIAALLRTGMAAHSTASGPMAEVVQGSTQHLSADDALAIGVYLKSLAPATQAPRTTAPQPAALEAGGKLYAQHCAQCHQASGEGSTQAWPPLAGNPTVTAPSPINAIRMVLEGGFAAPTADNPRPHGMPPFGQVLNDNDTALLVTYIRNSWGNSAAAVTSLEVKRARESASAN